MGNPWASSFDEYRQTIIGEGKGKEEPRWQDDDCDTKWYEKSDTDGKISKREKKAKAKHCKEEKYDNTKSPDYETKKKELAKKHGGAKNIKGHPQYEHHGIDIEHLDGTQTQIVDVVKAPKMVAAPKLSNWREDFVWDEALKNPKLELEGDGKKDVKNKVEINPTVATEGYMSKDKEGHTTGGFRISNKEAKKAKERLKKKYKKEEVEQIDEIDGSKLGIGLAAGTIAGGLKLMQSAKQAAERLRKKRSDAMKKALGESEVVNEKISASGYARAKKWREDQAREKDRKEQEYFRQKAKTHKWDGEKWNKRENVSEGEEKKNFDEAKVKYYSGQDRNPNTGLPKGLKATPIRTEKEVNKKLDRTTLAQSYEPESEVISEGPSDVSNARTKAQYKGPGAPGLDAHNERIRKHKEKRGKKKKKEVKEGILDSIKSKINFIKTAKDTVNKYNDKLRKNADAINQIMPGTAKVSEEVVTELNRYEKETGKSSGSMNMPKGRPTKKGGTSSPVMRAVRTSVRKETGKPHGQKKKTKGEKGNRQPGDRRTTPADTIAKRRQSKKDAEKLMRDTSGT